MNLAEETKRLEAAIDTKITEMKVKLEALGWTSNDLYNYRVVLRDIITENANPYHSGPLEYQKSKYQEMLDTPASEEIRCRVHPVIRAILAVDTKILPCSKERRPYIATWRKYNERKIKVRYVSLTSPIEASGERDSIYGFIFTVVKDDLVWMVEIGNMWAGWHSQKVHLSPSVKKEIVTLCLENSDA